MSLRALYERWLLPHLIDLACGQPKIQEERAKLIPQAAGRVLEIGLGTGRNLPFYDPKKVTKVVGVDPAGQMRPKAEKRARKLGLIVELVAAPAEALPFEPESFDAAVSTFTLCSVKDPLEALRQLRRVLKPGAPLLFVEHGLAPDPKMQKWQERVDRFWPSVAGGCHVTRDVPSLLATAGFDVESLQAGYLDPKGPWTYRYAGLATKRNF